MRRLAIVAVGAVLAVAAAAGDLKSGLSADRPQDRAILRYLERAEAKTATAAELTELGVLLAATNRLADAEQWLRRAVKLDKHSFAARYRLGLVQQRLGSCADAAKSFSRALRERPDDPYARFMLALARERCGSTSGAIADYARAYTLMPGLADADANPLVLDSDLQTQATLTAYHKRTVTGTFPVAAVDPAAVRAMMAVRAPATPAPVAVPAAAVAPSPAAAPAPAAGPAPSLPAPETIHVPAPAPAPTPSPAPPPVMPPPGAPGGRDPRSAPPG